MHVWVPCTRLVKCVVSRGQPRKHVQASLSLSQSPSLSLSLPSNPLTISLPLSFFLPPFHLCVTISLSYPSLPLSLLSFSLSLHSFSPLSFSLSPTFPCDSPCLATSINICLYYSFSYISRVNIYHDILGPTIALIPPCWQG